MKPPFRWVGGKTKMLPHISKYVPDDGKVRIERYFEPMVGGGALFFDWGYTAANGRCFLNDINIPLMHTYQALRDNFSQLKFLVDGNSSRSYNEIREAFNDEKRHPRSNPVRLAVPFIMLMATCFNGLYRENKSGGFNTPRGGSGTGPDKIPYDFSRIDWQRLEWAALALQGADLQHGGCLSAWPWQTALPGLGDVVFYDPPYAGEFSDYDATRFTLDHHATLRDQAQGWADNGASVIVCGSNNEWSWKVYGKPTEVVNVRRTVGNSLRGDATEALYVFKALT